MISLEYIIAQHQDGNVSVAINSRKQRQQNPAIHISRAAGVVTWQLRGLNLGDIETITGDSRVTRIDFYIGMDDLSEQRALFPPSTGTSLGLPLGLRNPVGTERRGGTKIKWRGAEGRIEIEDILMTIPPFKFKRNHSTQLILNIDTESSPYPIVSDGGSRTIRELHFGIEHNYIVSQNGSVKIPRITLKMTEDEYTTILDVIDKTIIYHMTI